jgi:ABC-type bacteriocin/lantibiotic exporter with double-glycine peptidase domain
MWQEKLKSVMPVTEIGALPTFAFQFFFRNTGQFRLAFALLTGAAVVSAVLRFYLVALLANLITNAATLSVERVLYWYLPVFLGATVSRELIDFLLRRFGEPFPTIYREYLQLRFFRTFCELRSHRLLNASKERLQTLMEKYVAHVERFLTDWFWGTARKLTQLVIVLGILYWQSPSVLAFNLAYIVVFLFLSFRLSRQISAIARPYSEQAIETRSVNARVFLNLNTVKRLRAHEFLLGVLTGLTSESWNKLDRVSAFHARRWLLQLNLFNVLYIGTLISGVLRVIEEDLPLGFLVLIKYAFDNLWDILTYTIEYYVSLITQKEDTAVIRNDLKNILGVSPAPRETCGLGDWREIRLNDAEATFRKEADGLEVSIRIPELVLRRGEKIGVIGESGAGKSTLLNMILGLVPFTGELAVDGRSIKGNEPLPGDVVLITSSDPFFNISMEQNLFLGNEPSAEAVARVLAGLKIDGYVSDLSFKYGDPGVHFSAGQEQRLRIARGVFQSADLYLLDEPFNGIDDDTKAEVMGFLKEFLRDKAVILVTHNAGELSMVDTVYEMNGGVLTRRKAE